MKMRPIFSIIAPIYNEIDNIKALYERVSAVMDPLGEPWEFVLIDDGSSDGSTEAILDLSKNDSKIVPVIFARNFGHQIAVTAGLDYSQGSAVIIIDADLQDPPEVILDLIGKWKEGLRSCLRYQVQTRGRILVQTYDCVSILSIDPADH